MGPAALPLAACDDAIGEAIRDDEDDDEDEDEDDDDDEDEDDVGSISIAVAYSATGTRALRAFVSATGFNRRPEGSTPA